MINEIASKKKMVTLNPRWALRPICSLLFGEFLAVCGFQTLLKQPLRYANFLVLVSCSHAEHMETSMSRSVFIEPFKVGRNFKLV